MKHSKKRFVLVPTDKASNNIAIICKRYYDKGILNEIGVFGNGNNTYCKANNCCVEIIDENTEYTKRLSFKITDKEKTLPIMYWIPKIHKNPTGASFIIASTIYSTKKKNLNLIPMSSSLHTPKLKILIKILNSYKFITRFLGVQTPSFNY